MEVKIPKEVRQHREALFFGLSIRQFMCSAMAIGAAAGVYLGLGPVLGEGVAGWLAILIAAPLAAAGFFSYNGMSFERLSGLSSAAGCPPRPGPLCPRMFIKLY